LTGSPIIKHTYDPIFPLKEEVKTRVPMSRLEEHLLLEDLSLIYPEESPVY